MEQEVAADVRPYLKALHEIEVMCSKEYHVICSAGFLLHPNGDGAVEVDFIFVDKKRIVVDFDEGYIDEAIKRLAEKVKTGFLVPHQPLLPLDLFQ